MKNIAVIYGGKSVEHDISVITALQVMKNLPISFNLLPVYIKPDGRMVTADNLTDQSIYLDYENKRKSQRDCLFLPGQRKLAVIKKDKIKEKMKVDCAILCNHGHGGEDGSLQGLLELCEIPFTSCSVASSAVCMDKVLTKVILKDAKILSPSYVHFDISEYEANCDEIHSQIIKKIKLPCIIKPARLGSSVGINICDNEASLKDLIQKAFAFDDKVIVEKFIANAREFCCAVLLNQGKMFESRVVEVKKGEIFTFEDKYLKEKENGTSQITKALEGKIKKLAKSTYKALECSGVVRVDFLYSENDELYVNEVNSIPGSLAFNLFDTSFKDLLCTLVNEAIKQKEKQKNIVYKFNSSAIENFIKVTNGLKFKT